MTENEKAKACHAELCDFFRRGFELTRPDPIEQHAEKVVRKLSAEKSWAKLERRCRRELQPDRTPHSMVLKLFWALASFHLRGPDGARGVLVSFLDRQSPAVFGITAGVVAKSLKAPDFEPLCEIWKEILQAFQLAEFAQRLERKKARALEGGAR